MTATEDMSKVEDATEEEFARAFKVALVGVPCMLILTVMIMALGGGDSAYFWAALWAALVGGPFFAGVAYLNVLYIREHAPAHRPAAVPPPAVGRPRAA